MGVLLAVAAAARAEGPASAPAPPAARARPPTTASAPASQEAPPPQTPGPHRLRFSARLSEKPVQIAYAVWLPKDYASRSEKRALIVFLLGAGEAGDNHEGIFVHGPAAELARNQALADWADFIVLSPQCPANLRWESPGMPELVLDLVDYALRAWRVDERRVYLTGLSMGGTGVWHVARAGPGRFAAVAPISANQLEPEKLAAALAGTTVWILVGGNDGDYTEGSRRMAQALAGQKVDVLLTEVPNDAHDTWGPYYSSRKFYEFLLLHRRGQPPPKDRPGARELLAISYHPPQSVDGKLGKPLQEFLPHWQILNCGGDMDPGLREAWGGRRKVFVTHPLDQATPCRLMTTLSLPPGKKSQLHLVVGHHPEGDWQLVVRADGKDLLSQAVGKSTARDGWMDVRVDLSAWAGKGARIELVNQASGWHFEAGYWGLVQVEQEPQVEK